jgi:uncharacterized protein YndB with AHSA1/START domain
MLGSLILVEGCGDSRDMLAASGSIDEDAPVRVHLQMRIAASPSRVWALLVNASDWPKWQIQIKSVGTPGPLVIGTRFTWKTGGSEMHSEIHLFVPERRLAWTSTAQTAKAIYVWELKPQVGGTTLVTMEESVDRPLVAMFYSSSEFATADNEWLASLKRAAEETEWRVR